MANQKLHYKACALCRHGSFVVKTAAVSNLLVMQVSMLPEQDIVESREMFMKLDADGDGMVSVQDLKKAGSLAVGFEDQVRTCGKKMGAKMVL